MPAMRTRPAGDWGLAPGHVAGGGRGAVAGTKTAAALRQLAAVPEEEVWLASQRSAATRRAYRADVEHFLRDLGLVDRRELRLVSGAAVVAWIRSLEARGARPSTIGRKVSALTSLFAHLVERHVVRANPCRDVKRPRAEATPRPRLVHGPQQQERHRRLAGSRRRWAAKRLGRALEVAQPPSPCGSVLPREAGRLDVAPVLALEVLLVQVGRDLPAHGRERLRVLGAQRPIGQARGPPLRPLDEQLLEEKEGRVHVEVGLARRVGSEPTSEVRRSNDQLTHGASPP